MRRTVGLNQTRLLTLLLCAAIGVSALIDATAQEATQPKAEPLPPTGTLIVITDRATARDRELKIADLPPGLIVEYSTRNDVWFMLPRWQGWVHQKHVLPLPKAFEHYSNIIAKKPQAEAFHQRGIVRETLGDYPGAIRDFNEAARLGLKDSAALHNNRGTAHQAVGDIELAVKDYSAAIKLDPKHAQAYDNRSGALAEQGEFKQSLEDSTQAIKLDPQFAEAYNNRGVTYRLMGKFEEALENYSKAIDLYPTYTAAFANRGFARKQLGRFEKAMDDYRRAMDLSPNDPAAFNDAAWLLATCRDETYRDGAEAVKLASRACDLTQHDSATYLDTLAAAHAEAGEFDEAIKWAEKAVEQAPEEMQEPIAERLANYRENKAFHES